MSDGCPSPRDGPSAARYAGGEASLADLATEYGAGRPTIHRIIHGPENPR